MKVLMTADTVGGVWTYAITLCKALERRGVSVVLATMGGPLSDLQRAQFARLTNAMLYESAYRLCWMADSAVDVAKAGQWLLQLERDIEPDLVHLNDLGHGNLPWRAPKLLVAHSCVYSWWQAVKHMAPPEDEWQDYHALVAEGLQNADLIVAPTEAMLNAVQRHYDAEDIPALAIANGRDFPELAPAPSASHMKKPLFFCAGRLWDDAKNLALIEHIAEQLPWPVYVAGESADPNGGAREHQGITALGFLSEAEIANWLQSAAVYVAPAKYEPFGLAVLEAARAGCALVLGDIASLREVWGDAALYVDPDQPEALQATLIQLTQSPDYRREMAQAAWLRAQTFTASAMADAYYQHYLALANPSTAAQEKPANATAGAHT